MGSVSADAEDATKGKDILEGAVDELDAAVDGEESATPEEGNSRRKRETPAPEPVPEEPPVMTYDEYLKNKTPAVLINPEFFKPVEVKVIETDLSGLSVKDKDDLGDFLVLGGMKVSKSKGKEQRSTVKSQGVKVADGFKNASLAPSPREDSDRRGDRGDRGARDGGKGGERNRRSSGGGSTKAKGATIDLGNNELFPTLGSK